MKRALLLVALVACTDPTRPTRAVPRTTSVATADTRANIVVIMTDDQRLDQGPAIMPWLRRDVADSGVTFTRGLHTGTSCCPSRAIFLSGQAQHNNGVVDNYGPSAGAPAFDHASSVAVDLQASGYTTAVIGKYMNDVIAMGPQWVAPGWDEWRVFKEGGAGSPFVARYYNYTLTERPLGALVAVDSAYTTRYSTAVIRAKALDFLKRAPMAKPVFLVLTPYAPHTAVEVLSGDVGKCNAYAFPEPASSNEADVSDKPAWVQAKPLLSPSQLAASRTQRKKQCESLQSVDRMIHDVIYNLRVSGRLVNTYVFFMSDNGFLWNEHRLKNRKHAAYLEGITVPFVVRGPGVARGAFDSSLVHISDLPATFRAIAAVAPGVLAHGQNLIPLLAAPSIPWTQELLIEHEVISHPEERFTALRTSRWHYIESPGWVELYDLDADPFEMGSVAYDEAYLPVRQALAARLAFRRTSP